MTSKRGVCTTICNHPIRCRSLRRTVAPDAIVITRRFGFRFLWIDALCIIQYIVEDWAQESSLMAGIYRNRGLMIFALAAPDGQHGVLSRATIVVRITLGEKRSWCSRTGHMASSPTVCISANRSIQGVGAYRNAFRHGEPYVGIC